STAGFSVLAASRDFIPYHPALFTVSKNPTSLALSSFRSLVMIPRLLPKPKQLLSVKSCYDTLSICRSFALTPVKKRNYTSRKPSFTAKSWLSHQQPQNCVLLPLSIHPHC